MAIFSADFKNENLILTQKDSMKNKTPKLVLNKALNIADVSGSALPDMMVQITKQMMEAEENVIKDVLRQLLKREPTLEDAKDLHRFQKEGEFDKYYLAYKNLKLGTVYRNTNIEGGKMVVEFVPFETKDFLELAEINGKVTF